ncbi:MAG: hypothetical protein R3D45_16470 [Rhizobiaceae bacterium]
MKTRSLPLRLIVLATAALALAACVGGGYDSARQQNNPNHPRGL